MADNTAQTGTDTIATDDLATLNGGASSGVKVQRVKVGYGDDGILRDISAAFPMPIMEPDVVATGTISATDAVVAAPTGTGALLSGASTANSYVFLACPGGDSAWNIQLTGTFGGGTVWFEESLDSTTGVDGNWIAVNGRQTGVVNTVLSNGATAAGVYRGNTSGSKYIRVRITGATAPSVAVTMRISSGVGATFLNASIPAGTNALGLMDVRGTVLVATSGAIAAAGTGTIGPLDVSRQGNVSFIAKNTVAASAWAGAPVLVFEQSDDNVSWSPMLVVRNDTGVVASTHVLGAGAANASLVFEAAVEAVNYVRCRVTTGPTTNGMTIVVQAGAHPFSPIVTAITDPTPSLPMGTATAQTPALTGQVGRVVRVTANVAQATAVNLINAPAAGTRIYVTNISCGNEGATLTVARLFAGSLPAAAGAVAYTNDVWDFPLAASGGRASMDFSPNSPWALPLATALSYAVTVATTWDITVAYYVAP